MRKTVLFAIVFQVFLGLSKAQVTQEWVARYNGDGNQDDDAVSMVIDCEGNIYVAGISRGVSSGFDYAVIKYSPLGVPIWIKRYNGSGNGEDRPWKIVADRFNNVYVTGGSWGAGTSDDITTIKYNSNGDSLWVRRYNGPFNNSDVGLSVIVDNLSNVYVTGTSMGTGIQYDMVTIKYDEYGAIQWFQRYSAGNNIYEIPWAITIDNQGNTYITGSAGSGSGENDCITIKYNLSGTEQWVQRYNGPADRYDETYAIVVDSAGNILVTGRSDGINTAQDYITIKYNSMGSVVWSKRYATNYWDGATCIAVDRYGNSYVSGAS